ncbi:MAG: hypothetical protein Ct9H90mP13_09510 [Pseudomonadota bacterium]|nr:MAG: hypothetical protein Ct9H90mP13_09510 [Pseudomonadota bacterium]
MAQYKTLIFSQKLKYRLFQEGHYSMAWILSWHALLRSQRSVVKKSWVIISIFFFYHFTHAEEVRVYNWSDYIDQSVIDQFEESTGIKVIYDVFDSNEVLEGKLLAGSKGYDIVSQASNILADRSERHSPRIG